MAGAACLLSATDMAAPWSTLRLSMARRGASRAMAEDRTLVAALCGRDERAFEALVERHHRSLVRVALIYVRDRAVAEEVAQETWLAGLEGIDCFEGRS